MANRQCCNVHILDYATMKPWMFVDFCNTTTAGFESDAVYANKKGAKDIKFDNPLEGTMTMVFQVHPFEIYALYSDGTLENSGLIVRREKKAGEEGGTITLENTPKAGTAYVTDLATGDIIEGTVAEKKFTATETSKIAVGTTYFFIQMETVDKDEKGNLVPVRITAYKASPTRKLDLSFSSDGDPAEITIEMSVLQNEDGDVMDIIEIEE